MTIVKITSGGQLSLPASIRRRWNARTVVVEDHDDHVIVRPAPADPVAATAGVFAEHARRSGVSTDEARRRFREEEDEADSRRDRSRA